MEKMNLKKFIPIIIGFVIILVAIIVIINALLAKKELNTKKLKDEDVYLYFSEEKFEFKGNITLDYDDHITNILLNDKKTTLYSEPIYYAKKKQLILPVPYSAVFAKSAGRQNKVNFYTELVSMDDDYYLVGKDLKYKINHNFLFDGSDFYIFVDDASVSFGDMNLSITPMSYVQYLYNSKDLYIYNYEEDKVYYFDNVTDDVFVKNEYYEVNLSADSLVINDKDKLLMKNFDYLKKLK